MTKQFEGIDDDAFLQALPSNVRHSLEMLDSTGADWEAVGGLLSNIPAAGVALKGVNWKATLWQAVKAEFHAFLCTDSPAYKDLRERWQSAVKDGPNVMIASLAGAIGAQLGMATGVLVPIVAWLCVVTARIGKQSICAAMISGGEGKPPALPPPEQPGTLVTTG